jgi:hypothetical protein
MWGEVEKMITTDFRLLFDAIVAESIDNRIRATARAWLHRNPDARTWLREFGARKGDVFPPATDNELWELYALSRVSSILLTQQFPNRGGDAWKIPLVPIEFYLSFMTDLGLERCDESTFSPFFHEIVDVDEVGDPDQDIRIVQAYWPSLMLGSMMFARGGVRISAGRNRVKKAVAENSTIYWTYNRRNRPSSDLSVGWGHNSSWRTKFRRDYAIGDYYYFNIDAAPNPSENFVGGLMIDEQAELIMHRCFVICNKPHDDLYPYRNKLTVRR